jgi:murein DD-endopeptidase MepM/ murein hydrolase activator NlpD
MLFRLLHASRSAARAASHPAATRRMLFAVATVVVAFIAPAKNAFARSSATWKVSYQPQRLVNGAPVLFEVKVPGHPAQMQATWQSHTIVFRQSRACGCWYALAGIALATKPGHYTLELEATSATGGTERHDQQVPVAAAVYPSTTIKVAPEYVEPPKENMARIEEEQQVKKEVFASSAKEPEWHGAFKAPADIPTSGVFGSFRLYNGVKRNQHTGLDFRAPTGTPVHASNAGTVILARPLYFEGNCIAIDHGQGLFTLFFHLSEFKVKEGEKVKRGQLVALSGGTGRSTAPHLHFAVRWQGEYLNPATLLKLTPP